MSQKSAPGPPMVMAVETPAMFPTPTVEARAVATAWKGVTVPVGVGSVVKDLAQHLAQALSEPPELDTPEEESSGRGRSP